MIHKIINKVIYERKEMQSPLITSRKKNSIYTKKYWQRIYSSNYFWLGLFSFILLGGGITMVTINWNKDRCSPSRLLKRYEPHENFFSVAEQCIKPF